ncbi:L-rhamnose mutarotase [Haloferula sp. A504]|uniref:L-rhamnose mutarotase n=1 Tax=Haloferula sp. A504 TaxID=3373601 RepID=UPI0031BCA5A2|nr:L-rhamnose mutarotase [Verrucomicrobiaceae bacterium E54]
MKMLLLPMLIVLFASCASRPVERYAMVTGLRPEKETRYRELHAKPWPTVIARLRECRIRNYSIHRTEIGGRPYLFSYFEYVGDDFEADMAKMAADPETQRWWKETDPCQRPLPEALKKGEIWTMAEEVFWTP